MMRLTKAVIGITFLLCGVGGFVLGDDCKTGCNNVSCLADSGGNSYTYTDLTGNNGATNCWQGMATKSPIASTSCKPDGGRDNIRRYPATADDPCPDSPYPSEMTNCKKSADSYAEKIPQTCLGT